MEITQAIRFWFFVLEGWEVDVGVESVSVMPVLNKLK